MADKDDPSRDITQVTRIIEDAEAVLRRAEKRFEKAAKKAGELPDDPEEAERIVESIVPPPPPKK